MSMPTTRSTAPRAATSRRASSRSRRYRLARNATARRHGSAYALGSGSRLPVLDGSFRGRIDLFRCQQDHRPDGGSPGRVDGEGNGRSALVVREVDNRVDVMVAEGEVEALD